MKLYIPKPLIAGSNTKTNYYAFGMAIQGRQFSGSSGYRYGFNGKENDKETVGTGEGTQDYGMRIYNPSLGKFLSVDPLTGEYPWNSTYAFAENDVIRCVDLDGAEKWMNNEGKLLFGPYCPNFIDIVELVPLQQAFMTATKSEILTDVAMKNIDGSATFRQVVENAGINKNVNISESNLETSTQPINIIGTSIQEFKVKIKVNNITLDDIGSRLTWELTNVSNHKNGQFDNLTSEITFKKLSRNDFIKGCVAIESEAAFNSYVAAREQNQIPPLPGNLEDSYGSMSTEALVKNKDAFIQDYTNFIIDPANKGSVENGKSTHIIEAYGKDWDDEMKKIENNHNGIED